jgi:ribosomal protein S6--L-glutamate ligase
VQDPFVLGWEEWLALPELGLPAIKAKVDTGARTSALHASAIAEIGDVDRPRVRFEVHPIPGRSDIVVTCVAPIVDRREVTSSNGEVERRYVIRTPVKVGDRQWPIEITLTNRESMSYRMLLGRQAIREDMFVDPARSFLQPQLGYRAYAASMRHEATRRPLTIAILSRRPENAGNRRLVRQAELRGHSVPVIDRRRVSLFIATREPAILINGRPLEPLDAVIFRAGKSPSAFSLAIVRQMELLGTYALNPADALSSVGDALVQRQMLARAGIAVPEVAVNPTDLARKPGGSEHTLADSLGALGGGPLLRFAIVGGRSLAVIERAAPTSLDGTQDWRAVSDAKDLTAARELAEAAARTVGLGLAAVDVTVSRMGPVVVDVTANLSISLLERLTGAAIAEAVVVHIERILAARVES